MKYCMTFLIAALLMTAHAYGETDTREAQVRTVLHALKTGDHEALRSALTEEFRTDLTDRALRNLAKPIQDRLQEGYQIAHLGTLIQDDFPVQFWKVSFEDGGEDVLLRIVVFDREIAGFLLTRPFV